MEIWSPIISPRHFQHVQPQPFEKADEELYEKVWQLHVVLVDIPDGFSGVQKHQHGVLIFVGGHGLLRVVLWVFPDGQSVIVIRFFVP